MAVESQTKEPMTSEKMEALMQKERVKLPQRTWKPIVAGVLSIVGGYLNILAGLMVRAGLTTGLLNVLNIGIATTPLAILLIVLGAISVIGGAFAVSRRIWPFGLVGAMATLFPSLAIIAGTLSLLFISLSEPEFHRE